MGSRASKLSKIAGQRGARRLEGARTTPRGYVPVCVGVNDHTKRFIVHTRALADADFVQLLHKSAEEFGFCSEGVLRIPFAAEDFEDWIVRASKTKDLGVKPA
ncbi:hypothetical protein BT93_J1785 [Corymbia citriodora subsp. variegata]|nr:hypothetical protein BT93_J1785 [Corymbia citriodora subsp. variegata]